VLVLVAGTELWVFSRDSYAWEAPVQGHVVESGGEVAREREWALLALSDDRRIVVWGHRDMLLAPPTPESPTLVDSWESVKGQPTGNPDQWLELYAAYDEAEAAAASVRKGGW
jgi:hypothetical protein